MLQKMAIKYVQLFTNDKLLDWSNIKAFADEKNNLDSVNELCVGKGRNIVGIGGNAGYRHFSLFSHSICKSCLFKRF